MPCSSQIIVEMLLKIYTMEKCKTYNSFSNYVILSYRYMGTLPFKTLMGHNIHFYGKIDTRSVNLKDSLSDSILPST